MSATTYRQDECQHERIDFTSYDEMGPEGYYSRDAMVCLNCDALQWLEDER